MADDVLKRQLTADFLFQVQLFVRELVLERGDLAVGERVVDGDRHLAGHAGQELDVLLAEGLFPHATQAQDAEATMAAAEAHDAVGLEALTGENTALLRRALGRVESIEHHGRSRLEGLPAERAGERDQGVLLEEALAAGVIEGVNAHLLACCIREGDARHITVHDLPHARQEGAQEVPQLQLRDEGVRQVQEQRQALLLALGSLEVQGVIDHQRHVVRHQREETDFLVGIGVGLGTAEAEPPKAAMHRREGQHAD